MTDSNVSRNDPKKDEIDELMLSAWLDEELDATEARRVQAAVDAQPALQQQVGRLLVNERRLREHYSAMVENRPVPAPLRALLAVDDAPSRPWFLRLSDWTVQVLPRPVMATGALALALVVGIQLGHDDVDELAAPGSSQVMTAIGPDHEWFELLESASAGERIALAGSATGRVALSYRDVDGHWCRQFEIQVPTEGSAMAAVACRMSGRWAVELAQSVPFRRQGEDLFRAASGAEAPVVDSYIMERMVGDVLMRDAERSRIEQAWQ